MECKTSETKDKWTLGDYVGLIGGIAGILSALGAGFAGCEAVKSRRIAQEAQALSQKAYDRSAGRSPAVLTLKRFYPSYAEIPQEHKKLSPLGIEEVLAGSPRLLQVLGPYLIVQNDGNEPIEALRLETKTSQVGFHVAGKEDKQWAMLKPWAIREPEIEEVPLARKLLPGEKAKVLLTPGIVKQMLKNGAPEYPGSAHFGHFEIRSYARLVGATSFDDIHGSPYVLIKLVWVPSEFSEDKCREFVQAPHTAAEIVPEIKK